MKNILFLLACTWMLQACQQKPDPAAFYYPAEWEKQEAVWLGWDGNWEADDTLHIITASIIKALQDDVDVVLWVSNDSLQLAAQNILEEQQVFSSSVSVRQIPGKTVFWTRDVAPVFVVNHLNERKAIDFNHTGYFRYKRIYDILGFDSLTKATRIQNDLLMMQGDSLMASAMNEVIEKSWLFIEGGAIEVNGKGTLLISEQFLFRNMSSEMLDTIKRFHVEQEFKRTLGVNNVIWLDAGLAEDDAFPTFYERKYLVSGTGGHVDEFARFVDAQTILLAWVEDDELNLHPVSKETQQRMKKNYDILKKAKDQDGKAFNIIKVPMPDLILKDFILEEEKMPFPSFKKFYEKLGFQMGDTLQRVMASSYLNFLITNSVVLLPSYVQDGGSAEKEERVKEIFTQHFPDRKLVFINSTYINSNGGGIHCITRQVPAINRTKISHNE
jgi:agmatine deiminase